MVFVASLSAKKPRQEDELMKKSRELTYEGQLSKAESLLHGKEKSKPAPKNDDGFTELFLSMLWGTIGFGFFVYGKKQSAASFLLCGILLCVFPFFVKDALASLVIGLVLFIVPFKI